jgi:hypothetical protein
MSVKCTLNSRRIGADQKGSCPPETCEAYVAPPGPLGLCVVFAIPVACATG